MEVAEAEKATAVLAVSGFDPGDQTQISSLPELLSSFNLPPRPPNTHKHTFSAFFSLHLHYSL